MFYLFFQMLQALIRGNVIMAKQQALPKSYVNVRTYVQFSCMSTRG